MSLKNETLYRSVRRDACSEILSRQFTASRFLFRPDMAISSLRRLHLQFTRQVFSFLPHLSNFSSAASDTIAKLELADNRKQFHTGMGCRVNRHLQGCYPPFAASFKRGFSATAGSQLPVILDPDIKAVFKDLMAVNWDEIPDSVVNETKKVLSKTTDDVAGKEALENVFRAAEASVEFGSTLVSLRMALDDLSGITGENVGHLPDGLEDAMVAAYKRYTTYLDSFGPDETYLRKKVETELGTKMIHLKMRCSGIGSEWGKTMTLAGVPEAIATAHKFNMRIIPGVALSAVHFLRDVSGVEEPLHILAYYGSCGPSMCEELEEVLANIREGRYIRAQ